MQILKKENISCFHNHKDKYSYTHLIFRDEKVTKQKQASNTTLLKRRRRNSEPSVPTHKQVKQYESEGDENATEMDELKLPKNDSYHNNPLHVVPVTENILDKILGAREKRSSTTNEENLEAVIKQSDLINGEDNFEYLVKWRVIIFILKAY